MCCKTHKHARHIFCIKEKIRRYLARSFGTVQRHLSVGVIQSELFLIRQVLLVIRVQGYCDGSGKKFWNLFYLQPMWVQKVAKCY